MGNFSEIQTKQEHCEKHGAYVSKGYSLLSHKITWSGCPVCSKEESAKEAAMEAAREELAKKERLERKLNQVAIPLRFRDKSFANFIANTEKEKKALTVAKQFAENFNENLQIGKTLIFAGSPGTGKSHLALSIAKQLMHTHTPFYVNALDAIRMVRDTWRRDSEKSETDILNMLGSIDLLIIDEVGVQYGTEGEKTILFDIINRRYRDAKPMILLTNCDKTELEAYLGERSFDRLRENGTWVSFEWESYRKQA